MTETGRKSRFQMWEIFCHFSAIPGWCNPCPGSVRQRALQLRSSHCLFLLGPNRPLGEWHIPDHSLVCQQKLIPPPSKSGCTQECWPKECAKKSLLNFTHRTKGVCSGNRTKPCANKARYANLRAKRVDGEAKPHQAGNPGTAQSSCQRRSAGAAHPAHRATGPPKPRSDSAVGIPASPVLPCTSTYPKPPCSDTSRASPRDDGAQHHLAQHGRS